MIFNLLRKIKALVSKKGVNEFTDQLLIKTSAIMLPGTRYDFRQTPEKRLYVEIGEKCLIKANFIFETDNGKITIGDNVHIGGATLISLKSIEIENDVTMAWGITIYDYNSHSINWDERKNDNNQCYDDYLNHNGNNIVNKDWTNVVSKPVKICSKAWIGFDAVILKGVTIGEGAVVAARSVVSKDVAPWVVVAGNPAIEVKKLNR